MRNILDESLFEEVELAFEEPQIDSEIPKDAEEFAVSDLLMDAIKDTFDLIQSYNTIVANIMSFPEIKSMVDSIAKEENEHIGKLQAALKTVSENAIAISDGETSVEDELDAGAPVEESVNCSECDNSNEEKPLGESWLTEAHEGLWTVEQMKDVLARRDDQVGKALVKLWERQTEDEKATHTTNEYNRIGFNGFDADILSSFAEQFQEKGWLSKKQIELARKKIMKYAKQLCEIANENIEVPNPQEIVTPEVENESIEESMSYGATDVVQYMYDKFNDVDFVGEQFLNDGRVALRFNVNDYSIDDIKTSLTNKFGDAVNFTESTYRYAPEIKYFTIIANDDSEELDEAVEEPEEKEKEKSTEDTQGIVMKAICGNEKSKSDVHETAALTGDYQGEIEYKDHLIFSNNGGRTYKVSTQGGEVKKSGFDSFVAAKAYVKSIVKD